MYTKEKVDEYRNAFRLSVGITLIFLGITSICFTTIVIPQFERLLIEYRKNVILQQVIESKKGL